MLIKLKLPVAELGTTRTTERGLTLHLICAPALRLCISNHFGSKNNTSLKARENMFSCNLGELTL